MHTLYLNRMRYYFNIIIMLAFSVALMAVPASPDTIHYRQADGSIIDVVLNGDEHFHYMTNLQGQWLRLDDKGNYVVAESLSEDMINARVSASPMRKARQKQVTQKRFPTIGSQKSLVILAQFEDLQFVTPNAQNAFRNMLNQNGYAANGATGSARDFFLASSNGRFNPTFVVVGPYTLPHPMAYYGANTSPNQTDRPARLMQFCRDAVVAASGDVDFAEYDTDNDGYIDNVFIYYAGYSEAEGALQDAIWPHQYGVVPDSVIGSCTFGGKTIASYACTAELKGNTGSTMCGIGTFCHEFGHVLGLPDYYHTAKKNMPTLGKWDIMDSGAYLNGGNTPPLHSAFNRFYVGWLSPVQINQATSLNLYALHQDTAISATTQAYLLAQGQHNMNPKDPNYKEYFIVEYRKKSGWDAYLPDSGMMVWHIDYDQAAWDANTVNNADSLQTEKQHLRVFIENPNGKRMISNPGAFHSGDRFMPVLWSGVILNQNISNIQENKDYCSFDFMGGGIDRTAPVAVEPDVLTYNSMRAAWHPVAAEEDYDVSYLFTAFTLAGGDTAYVVRREEVRDTTFLLSGLKSETIYTYFVSAYLQMGTDAVESFRSNIVKATTTAEKSKRKMTVHIVGSGSSALIYVDKPSSSDELYVFDETSRLLMTVNTNNNLECVNAGRLQTGHTYIFRAGSKYAKVVL